MATAEKIPFYTRYKYPDPIPNKTGEENDPVKQWQINDKGIKELVTVGYTNRYEKIQSWKEECDIHQIIAKATIDPTQLNQREGFYGDITEMPKNMAEFQTLMQNLKNEFLMLPPEKRSKFGSFEQYCAEAGTETWMKKMDLVKEAIKEEPEQEKGEVENES